MAHAAVAGQLFANRWSSRRGGRNPRTAQARNTVAKHGRPIRSRGAWGGGKNGGNCSEETLGLASRLRRRRRTRATKHGGRRAAIGAPGRRNKGPGKRKGKDERSAGGGRTNEDERNQICTESEGGEKVGEHTQQTGGAPDQIHGVFNDGDGGADGGDEEVRKAESDGGGEEG